MSIDPAISLVVFKIDGQEESLADQVETQAVNGIQQVWDKLNEEDAVDPKSVTEIYSDWSATDEDVDFLKSVLPHAEFFYSFVRPEDESEWDSAFAAAERELAEQMSSDEQASELTQPELLPVLRDYDETDELSKLLAHTVVGDGLCICLAMVGPTEQGTIGVDYVMESSVESAEQLEEMFDEGWDNFCDQLMINMGETEDGDRVCSLEHPSDHASSAIALPHLFEDAREWLREDLDEILIAIPDPGNFVVAKPGTSIAEQLKDSVINSEYWGAVALTPSVFMLTENGLRRELSRPAKP